MRRALVLVLGTALVTTGLGFSAFAEPKPTPVAAAADSSIPPPGWKRPRNAMGQPDLSGYWSNATLTPLVRNRRISDKATLTAEEAKAFEKLWAQALAESDAPTDQDESTQEVQAKLASSKLVELRPDFIGNMIAGLMERDANKDKKLSKEEAGERWAENFAAADTNKDNQLDEAELRKWMSNPENFRFGGGRGRDGDRGRDGEGRRPGGDNNRPARPSGDVEL